MWGDAPRGRRLISALRSLSRYLQEELVLSDPLHRLDKVGGDGVGQSVPLLDLLQNGTRTR